MWRLAIDDIIVKNSLTTLMIDRRSQSKYSNLNPDEILGTQKTFIYADQENLRNGGYCKYTNTVPI